MKVIGITGSSGSGKSIVSEIIARELNAKLILSDILVRQMQKPGREYYEEIVNLFGIEFLNKNQELNRKKIAKDIFKDKSKRQKLNNLTRAYVVEEIKRQILDSNEKYVVIDAPLLIETELNQICNTVIAVISDKKIQIKRICKRDNITEEEAIARIESQQNNEFYKEHADFIIENKGEIDDKFMGRIREIMQKLQ